MPTVRAIASTARTPWGRPAADGEALELQRRPARQHREEHPQARVGGAAPLQEGEPGGLHVGDVGRHRRPPGRAGGEGEWRGARVDEQRRRARLEAGEHRAETLEAERRGQCARRQGEPDRAAAEQRVGPRRVRRRQRDGAPDAEGRPEGKGAVVPRRQRRLGLLGRERLQPERVHRARSTRSTPSAAASAARVAGWCIAGSTGVGASPANASTPPSIRGGAGRPSRRASSGAGQRC